MDPTEKTRENRLRRVAYRQGLQLIKSRRKDERALDFGKYWLVRNGVIASAEAGLDLDAVEALLNGEQA